MCGIFGYITKKDKFENKMLKLINTMEYRGPDNWGFEKIKNNKNIYLGHRRLSIIDLSDKGKQPMYNEDRTICITYNGEIYNFQSIKKELEDKHRFKSDTDTEVIIHAYEEWGLKKTLNKLNGMFAFALYDKNIDRLFLVRDRIGIKPLYYYRQKDKFLFASELKPIIKSEGFTKKLNQDILPAYLSLGFIPSPSTIFKGVFKLEPGQMLVYDIATNNITKEKYWDAFELNMEGKKRESEKEIIDNVESLLKDSVRNRLISDVPLGVFLSGGIDSTLITSFANEVSNSKLKTFTIGFEDESYNEANYAKQIAEFLDTDHHELYINENDLLESVEKIPDIFDEPFADPAIIPTTLLSDFTKNHVTVALSGDGGDELFYGYNNFDYVNKLNNGFYKFFSNIARKLNFDNLVKNYRPSYLSLFQVSKEEELINSFRYLRYLPLVHNLLERESNTQILKKFKLSSQGSKLNVLEKYSLNELITYLPDDLLVKTDKCSMYSSLEVRVPMLDHNLIEYVYSLPSTIKYKGEVKKYILKKILNNRLPKQLFNRPKKGFNVPLRKWLLGNLKFLINNYLSPEFLKKQGIFNHNEVQKILSQFKKYDDNSFTKVIWNLLIFQLWYNNYLE